MATSIEEILASAEQLSPADQRRVLEFIKVLEADDETHQRLLAIPKSPLPEAKIPPSALVGYKLPLEDVEEIEKAIQDCERIDIDEWKLSA
jgi:hypothetical protein